MGSIEKAIQIKASQIKPPFGRVNEKYVYTYFIAKMRINFGSLGLLQFNLFGIMYQEGLWEV